MRKLLLIGLIATVLFTSCTKINPGHEGLKVNLSGGERGSSKIEPCYGWVGYMPGLTTIIEIDVRNQHYISEQPMTVQAKGGTNVIVHPSFNYRITSGKIDSLYIAWGVTDDQQIQGKLLEATLLTSMREVTNGWTIDSLLNYRGNYDLALQQAMDIKLRPYVSLFQFTSGVTPDPSMAAAIADKAGSIQRAQAAENKKRETQALADLEIIKARKDSSVAVINASGQAKAIEVLQHQLTPTYVDYIKANAWDGKLPTYMMGSNTSTLLNLK